MSNRRKITIVGLWMTPLEKKAFTKLIRYYYKGTNDLHVRFDKRIGPLGDYCWDHEKKRHQIRINPKWCSFGKSFAKWDTEENLITQNIVRMNTYDKICKLIWVFLHEIKHAMQRDRNPRAWNTTASKHEFITQSYMGYRLSECEAEAEGWALLNFNKALERYESWCE